MCDACDYRWIPCRDQYCRGYRVTLDGTIPTITGCPECDGEHGGVRSDVVQWWPEAWRAVARRLDERLEAREAQDAETTKGAGGAVTRLSAAPSKE